MLCSRIISSTFEALRPAASPRDPGILLNAQACCTEIDRTRSRGQAAGRRIRAIIDQNMKYQQTLQEWIGLRAFENI